MGKIALSIDKETGRIKSAYMIFQGEYQPGTIFVESLPDKPVSHFRYVNGELVYDPPAKPESEDAE